MNDEALTSSGRVAAAVGDALRNEAIREAVLEFGGARILLTRGQRLGVRESVGLDVVPEYPAVETSLLDDTNSWLS